MKKIREILEKHTEYTDQFDERVIFEGDFDKLEKELQEYVNKYKTVFTKEELEELYPKDEERGEGVVKFQNSLDE